MAGCRERQLNWALFVVAWVSFIFFLLFTRATPVALFCVFFFDFCFSVVLIRLSVSVQVIDRKDTSPKWPIMCWWGHINPTHSLTHHRSLHYIKLKIFKVAKVITSGTTGCNKPDKLQYIVRMRLSKPMCCNDDDDDFCRWRWRDGRKSRRRRLRSYDFSDDGDFQPGVLQWRPDYITDCTETATGCVESTTTVVGQLL